MAQVVHTIKGKQYLYEHTRVGKKVVCKYIGPVGSGGKVTSGVSTGVTQQKQTSSFNVKYTGKSPEQKKHIENGLTQFDSRFPIISQEIKEKDINVFFVEEHGGKSDFIMKVYYPNIYVNKNKKIDEVQIQHELIHAYQDTKMGINEKREFQESQYLDDSSYWVKEYHAYAYDGLISKLNENYSKNNFNKDEVWVAKRHNIKIPDQN